MGSLIFGYVLAGLVLAGAVLGGRRIEQRIGSADAQELRDHRAMAESPLWVFAVAGWATLCAVGGVVLLARGHLIGSGWLGLAALLGVATWAMRRRSRRILALLGDRGRVEHGPRHDRWRRISTVLLAIGLAATFGRSFVEIAVVEPLPPPAEVADLSLSVLSVVGFLGFAITWGWAWARGYDLPGTPRRD